MTDPNDTPNSNAQPPSILWLVFSLLIAFVIIAVVLDLRYPWSSYPANNWIQIRSGTGTKKLVWDWLELLIVPFVLAISAFLFAWYSQRNDRRIAEIGRLADRENSNRQMEVDRELANRRFQEQQAIEETRAQEAALEAYIGQLSIYLVENELKTSSASSAVRDIARVWTMTILRRLSGDQKGFVLSFLAEANLIEPKGRSIVPLLHADLREVRLEDAELYDIDLSSVRASNARLTGSSLYNFDMVDSNFANAKLSSITILSSNLENAILNYADLSYGVIRNSVLKEASLVGATLNGVALSDSDLSHVNLSDANLLEAEIEDCNFDFAILRRADLSFCNMRGTTFHMTHLEDAILYNADLTNVDLSSCRLAGALLSGARYDSRTKWPSDYTPPANAINEDE